MVLRFHFFLFFILGWITSVMSQNLTPGNYQISGIVVEGTEYTDKNTVILLSGLSVGSHIEIPSSVFSDAVQKLWEQKLFSDISIELENVASNKLFIKLKVTERPRISKFKFEGISKSNADDLREKIKLVRGTILTEPKKRQAIRIIKNYYQEKGFYTCNVQIDTQKDPENPNGEVVKIKIEKGPRVKIKKILVSGIEEVSASKIKKQMKNTKEMKFYRFWARSKFIKGSFQEDLQKVENYLHGKGFRDAKVEKDTFWLENPKRVMVSVQLSEGKKYYFRNITWVGNTKYSSEYLSELLGIKKGDVYDTQKLDRRLSMDPNGTDVSSLYLDDGYLFFRAEPEEIAIIGDSVDIEIRITEGAQAMIDKIYIEGNTKTSDYVILRELRTLPGEKFSRADLIRSQREILALGFFDQEKMNVIPMPNPEKGTVDLKYVVQEKSSDQLQLQGGYGGRYRDINGNVIGGGFVGTLGLNFNNFSTKRFFKKGAWNPIPSGDGQKLSINAQLNGVNFQNYAISFMEPWFGGKKPNSFGVSANYSMFKNPWIGYRVNSAGASVDLGRRMKFPDDFFRSYTSLNYRNYDIKNGISIYGNIDNAFINILSLRQTFDRSSIDAPIFPRTGSQMTLSVEVTPPWSYIFKKDWSKENYSEKIKWMEFHKWKFDGSWFVLLSKKTNTVINARFRHGLLGGYNPLIGPPPFERFVLGGQGLAFGSFDGREFIGLRGYEPSDISPNNVSGSILFSKYTLELRQPVTLEQSATIWFQTFLDAGNAWQSIKDYNPFSLKPSAGAGVRLFLPFFGLLGVDFAHRLDGKYLIENGRYKFKPAFIFVLGQQL